MRRLLMMAGVLALAGCSNFRDVFSAHAGQAATAGPMELKSERLAEILTAGKGLRANREAAEFVSNVWVDYALFAQAVAGGEMLTDSATIAAAMWPEIAELRGAHFHDSLMARRANVSPSAADSLYRGNDVRLLQHILFKVDQGASAQQKAAARQKAEATLRQVRGGADFGRLASELSDDPGSKSDSGFLPPAPRNVYVGAFDSAGWALAPGAMTGIVETPFGFHIIRRPTFEQVQDRLLGYIKQSAAGQLDSVYMDSLAIRYALEVKGDAPARMKEAANDPESLRDSDDKLVTFKGGALTTGEFLRWVLALPPQYIQQVKSANEDQLRQFARALGQNVLLLHEADSAGVTLSKEEWLGMQQAFRAQVDTLRNEMELSNSLVTDSTASRSERMKAVELKVDQYFDRLTTGKVKLRPLPSTLGRVLRERMEYDLYPAGLAQSVDLAEAIQSKKDSASGGPRNPGALVPAPGQAPVPGGAQPAPAQPAPDSARK